MRAAIDQRIDHLTDWIPKATPANYVYDESFWIEWDRDLQTAIGTGNIELLDERIVIMKERAVAHYLPFHRLPGPGETLVVMECRDKTGLE